MVVGDLEGKIHTVIKRSYVSHYYWIGENEILAHANCDGTRKALYIINATTGEYREVAKDYLGSGEPDIHCQISPDGEYVIGDGYPINGYRSIVSIKLKTGESRVVVSAKTIIPKYDDVRCDLHARFVMNGRYISYDTTEHNRREVALFPTELIRF